MDTTKKLDLWQKRITAMYRGTQQAGKRKYLGSVLVQLVDYASPPTPAQEALLMRWWKHHQAKYESPVIAEAREALGV